MDFYYNKSMGNGTVTSKFRLNPISASTTTVQSNQSNLRSEIIPKDTGTSQRGKSQEELGSQECIEPEDNLKFIDNKEISIEANTHHSSNCNRCYRLKKKCSREYPKCGNCVRTSSDCEYVNRTNKRRKRVKVEPGQSEEKKSSKLVSVSSLLSNESQVTSSNETEFITMKPIDTELPLIFVLNYFENYSYQYPFINKTIFLQEFNKIDFSKESIINLDIYLLMSIGCLIYDSKCNTKYYHEYFKEKNIESIVDIGDKFNFDSLKLIVLLTIHSITCINKDLTWNLIGVLTRAVIKWNMYTSTDLLEHRLVWTIHNLDKELSLLLKKPSQFPNYEYVTIEFPLIVKLYEEENLHLVNQNIELYKLQGNILHLNLTNNKTQLHEISGQLEKWRTTASKVVHQSSDISDFISWINLQYYYLLIELDQISDIQSFQFTLHFLSNSFTLLISSSDKQKSNCKLSLVGNLFWFVQLINVIRFNIGSLKQIIEANNDSTKLEEFNSNLLLILNLLKYIKLNFTVNQTYITILLIEETITKLTELSLQLMKFKNEGDKTKLFETIETMQAIQSTV